MSFEFLNKDDIEDDMKEQSNRKTGKQSKMHVNEYGMIRLQGYTISQKYELENPSEWILTDTTQEVRQ